MGRLVVEDVVLEGGGTTPLVGGRVRLLPLDVVVVGMVLVLLSRFLFGLRLDPKEAPNCLIREFIRTSACVVDVEGRLDCLEQRVGEGGRWG